MIMERIKNKLTDLEGKNLKTVYVNQEKLENFGLTDIELRPYQVDGVNWLIERFHRNHGCILGDEMGLGKTCQSISYLVYLLGNKCESGPFLVLSPLSVTANWKTELRKFAPSLNLLVYQGDKDHREELRHKINKGRKHGKIPFDVLLTTYELLLKDESFLRNFSWSVLVVDEAHRLKNQESLLHQALCQFDINHRLLLTGTPVQNNLDELYSLLCFVAPSIFREKYREPFLEEFENVDADTKAGKKDVGELHKLLQPFLLRRVKSEVVKDLPKKSEVLLYHGLTALQKKYYKAILTKDLEVFENTNPGGKKTSLMNILVQLRKCVNHPYLFDGVEPEPFMLGEHLVDASGKLILIDQLLGFLKPGGHKVLLFSQMTRMLDIIQDYLGYRGYNYERLDGSVRGEERFLAIQNFNEQEDNFVFLLSTKAGGQGLNLTSADTVIFVDSDFNPQNDLQAAARAHRIGQTRPVRVIRLIGRSTVEEIVLRRAEAKLKLTNTVIEGGQFSLGESKEALIADNNIQLQDILKFGLDQLFENEDSSVDDVDFEKILGPSCDGEWQLEETLDSVRESQAEVEPEDDTPPQSMYVFEGTDYSKEPTADDKKVFDQIIAAERVILEATNSEDDLSLGKRPTRKKSVPLMGLLPDVRKPKKQLTPEELEERRKKKKEATERRAQMAEEEEVRKSQERRKRREDMWTRNGYVSCNIVLDSEGESDADSEGEGLDDNDEDTAPKRSIQYVSGDVTHPINTGSQDAFVLHCADDSGKWGVGGLFSAIGARSPQPQEQYELAGKMIDLALGDCHLMPIDDVQKRADGKDYLALVIAQHRDRHHNLSGIKLSALSKALEKVYKAAKEKKASVHLPRIGYKTPGFNWYGTERLIRKHLASRGIPTSIYYYPRKHNLKRKGTGTTPGSSSLKVRRTDSGDGEAGPSSTSSSPVPLSDIFSGVSVYLYKLQPDVHKKLKRYIIAYDGDVDTDLKDSTTHIVAFSDDKEDLKKLIEENSRVQAVTIRWIEDSVKKGKKLEESGYTILD